MLLAAKSGAGKAARAPKPLNRQILQAVVILPFRPQGLDGSKPLIAPFSASKWLIRRSAPN
jgi:hypothetical protein